MKANEMEPGPRNERGQGFQEFERRHHEMGGAIAIRGCELQHDLTGPGAAEPFVAEGGARDVAAETFEFLSLLGTLRDELLNGELFFTLREAQLLIEQWREHYNHYRPHSALGDKPPAPASTKPVSPYPQCA